MKKPEIARWLKNLNVAKFLHDNHDDLILIELYAVEEAEHIALMAEILTAINREAEDIKVITAQKQLIKEDLALNLIDLCLRASVQAHQLHLNELSIALDRPVTYITQANDINAETRSAKLISLLTNTALTCITHADIINIRAKASEFNAIKILPKHEIKERKAQTTNLIPIKLNLIDESENRIGKLIHSYRKNFISTWDEITKVGKPIGVHHTSIIIKLLDETTNVPLSKVKVTATNGIISLVHYTTNLGWVRFFSLETGNWSIQAEFETYQPDEITNIGVDEENTAKFEIKLKKVPPPPSETPSETQTDIPSETPEETPNEIPPTPQAPPTE
ncbi:MAG: carboxypeptidase-like regulatory domain-containing protein [Bacteroidota bacterium]